MFAFFLSIVLYQTNRISWQTNRICFGSVWFQWPCQFAPTSLLVDINNWSRPSGLLNEFPSVEKKSENISGWNCEGKLESMFINFFSIQTTARKPLLIENESKHYSETEKSHSPFMPNAMIVQTRINQCASICIVYFLLLEAQSIIVFVEARHNPSEANFLILIISFCLILVFNIH